MWSNLYILIIFYCKINGIFSGNTDYIDKRSKLVGFPEVDWYLENIPFIDVPSKEIEDVYYYRWSSLKRHLKYNLPGAGFTITEFVHKVFYSQKFDTINAAAGHHIYETRWLRDQRFVTDYINFWARGGGAPQQYSEWIADAAYSTFLLNGDLEFIKSQQDGFAANFRNWETNFEPELGLYFISPHDDAMEYSASSIPTDDPMRGGLGYRPSFNSEMYGNAVAISKIARLSGDLEVALEFETRAELIRDSINRWLWDDTREFYYHMHRENNTGNELIDSREEIGVYPWRWNVPPSGEDKYSNAWSEMFNADGGFYDTYGPTTCEKRSPWFDGNQTNQCCWWNGNSWPYSTSHAIQALASHIKNYGETIWANVESFADLLLIYAKTQFKNGVPYVAECHSPWQKIWVCDSFNHSEHYAHSVYNDIILSDLIGLKGSEQDILEIEPLIPPGWDWFLVENILYHGSNITIIYDKDGTHYNLPDRGLMAFVNGVFAGSTTSGYLRIPVPPTSGPDFDPNQRVENYACNQNREGYPRPDASYTSPWDNTWQGVDGRIFYDAIPSNRWTNWDSPNTEDWFSIDFGPGREKLIHSVKLYIYSDFETGEGVVDCPISLEVQIHNGVNWSPALNQIASPCVPNDAMTVIFDPVSTRHVRVIFTRDVERGLYVGFTELEILAPWPQAPPGVYEAEDGLLSNAHIFISQTASGGSFVGNFNTSVQQPFLEFCGVWVDKKDDYSIKIYYANAHNEEKNGLLRINHQMETLVNFPPTTGGWGHFNEDQFSEITMQLQRGNNFITLFFGDISLDVDKINISI